MIMENKDDNMSKDITMQPSEVSTNAANLVPNLVNKMQGQLADDRNIQFEDFVRDILARRIEEEQNEISCSELIDALKWVTDAKFKDWKSFNESLKTLGSLKVMSTVEDAFQSINVSNTSSGKRKVDEMLDAEYIQTMHELYNFHKGIEAEAKEMRMKELEDKSLEE
jgi:hypothetical protein